ncbi:MAG: hypothetical protein QM654_10640 [Dysgonamonadaceae bacterium]
MAIRNSYNYQKELLSRLMEQLEQYRGNLNSITKNYKAVLDDFHENNGLMDEIYQEYFENFLSPTMEAIDAVATRMEHEDVAFIQKEIDFLSSR